MFWTDIARFLQYFINLSNSFINIFAILQDFNRIFSKYSFNITVLCGYLPKSLHEPTSHYLLHNLPFLKPTRISMSNHIQKNSIPHHTDPLSFSQKTKCQKVSKETRDIRTQTMQNIHFFSLPRLNTIHSEHHFYSVSSYLSYRES